MNTEPHKKAVAYIRISSIKQIENESPVTQREKIQSYADANNIEIIENGWFFDEAKSGKNADREELQNLLSFALKHKGKIDYVIVYKMNRASRDLDSYVQQVRVVLKTRGITVRSATEPVDDTKMGRFMESFLVLMGQLDNEGKAESTVDNMRSLALQGYWQHPPIVGYVTHKIMNELGQPRPTLKPDDKADKVREVLERFSKGDINKAKLTEFAYDIGLRSRYGKRLSKDSINRLIKSPTYAGYVRDFFTDYELVEGAHPAIISKETYKRNQALLYPAATRKGEVHLKQSSLYPLKGLLLCSSCKKRLYASAPKTGNGGYSPRYHCSRPECRGKAKSVRARKVHDDFEELLTRIKPSQRILDLYKTVLVREANNELGRLNGQIKRLREDLSHIDETRVNAIREFTNGTLSLGDKNSLTSKLDIEKAQKTAELELFEGQQDIRESDIEVAINVMSLVDQQWAESEIDIKIRFQNMLFPEGVVYNSLNGNFGTSQISPLYRYAPTKKDLSEPEKSFLVAGAGLEPATLWL